MYEALFEPLKIGKLEIKNRFVMPAMDSHYTTAEHQFSKQALNYYCLLYTSPSPRDCS